jgi:flavin reductase (DIM6/NTAB) family NADH-FMN oxidoreductase RutF
MPQAVFVVTGAAGSVRAGMTACWVVRVSHRPPLYAVAIHHSSQTRDVVAEGNCFCIHILRADQVDLARRFGSVSGRDADKFAGLAWRPGASGAPILQDVMAFLDCQVVSANEVGDHSLFVGRLVEEGVLREAGALIFRPSDFADIGQSGEEE